MKLGTENKKEVVIMACLLAVAIPLIVYTVYNMSGGGASADTPAAVPTASTARPQNKAGASVIQQNSLDPTLRKDYWEASRGVKYESGGRNIFTMEAEPIPTPIASAKMTPTPTPPPPTPTPFPPIPIKFYGFENSNNQQRRVFLSSGESTPPSIFVARVGDIIDRRYRVAQVTAQYVVMEDVLTSNKQQIPLTVPPR